MISNKDAEVRHIKYRTFYLWIGLWVVVDQLIKIFIYQYYFNANIRIISDLVWFRPMQNTAYSYLNALFDFGIGRLTHIVLVVIALLLTLLAYDYIHYNRYGNALIGVVFIALISGTACSLIDKVFWNGSLDYIYLKNLFTFDLKDCYITVCFGILGIISAIKYRKALNTFKFQHLIRHAVKRLKAYRKPA